MADPAGTGDTLLLCRSEGRAEKEAAIRSNAQARLEKDLAALVKRVASGRLKETDKIDRAIGRVLAKHPRAEDGFRMLRSNLGLRPNRHHIERRVDSPVFICILLTICCDI